MLDFSSWATKTPEATVRRIVQLSKGIFKVESGLWALEECREDVFRKFSISVGDRRSEEVFSHGYYQGLLVEIGKMESFTTYVPSQDKNRKFLDGRLCDIVDHQDIPPFSYQELVRKAQTVDVVWFNERRMPCRMFEVEHTTDMKNSLGKFYELQDFHVRFAIVADASRRREFDSVMSLSIYAPIRNRVGFICYDSVASKYNGLRTELLSGW